MSEDLADALSVQSESAIRHVPVFLRLNHVADASDLFNYLTGYSAKSDYKKLLVAPINLRKRLETLIARLGVEAGYYEEAAALLLDQAHITGKILQGQDNFKSGVAIWSDIRRHIRKRTSVST